MAGKNGHIHYNILSLSSMDTVELAKAVEARFIDLCEAHLRIRGSRLALPKELDQDMLRWREMRVRHKSGDYRNTHSELRSTQVIAQWTVDINRAMRNQKPQKIVWALED